MVRSFTNYFDAVMFYDRQVENVENQIRVLLKQRNDLILTRDHNKRMLEQERIQNR